MAAEPWRQGGKMPPLDFLRGGGARGCESRRDLKHKVTHDLEKMTCPSSICRGGAEGGPPSVWYLAPPHMNRFRRPWIELYKQRLDSDTLQAQSDAGQL